MSDSLLFPHRRPTAALPVAAAAGPAYLTAGAPTPSTPTGHRRWPHLLLALGLLLGAGAAFGSDPSAPLAGELDALLAYADRHSPRLAAAGFESSAARARIGSAAALADPMLRIEADDLFNDGPALTPAQTGRTRYQLMQEIPWAGKRGLRREIAAAEADRSAAAEQRMRSELRREIRMAHADWQEAEARLQVLDDTATILHDAEAIARARYAAGLVPQGDVLRAQLELTELGNERLELAARSRAAVARLNGLLGRRGDAVLLLPEDEALQPLPPLADAERRLAAAPEIAAADAFERAATQRDNLTLRERWPDLKIGVMAMQQGSKVDEWGLMLELNLPLWQARRRADEAESRAMRDAAHALREDSVLRALAGLRQAHAEADGARAQHALISDTLAVQAELALTAASAAYRSGAADFLGVIDAALQLRRARIAALTASAMYRRRLAEYLDFLGDA
jgi:outer membrane protein, heavy metal efflux system